MKEESLIDFARDILQVDKQLRKAEDQRIKPVRRDHTYLYTVKTYRNLSGISGPATCLDCKQEVDSKRHPCIEIQIETFEIWQAAHLLGVEVDDVVYLRKELIR